MSGIVLARAHLRPSRALRRRLGIVGAVPGMHLPMGSLLAHEEKVSALACLLTEAIETRQSKDGRIDMRDVAAHVIAEMEKHQR